jgi:hypothetical protein
MKIVTQGIGLANTIEIFHILVAMTSVGLKSFFLYTNRRQYV